MPLVFYTRIDWYKNVTYYLGTIIKQIKHLDSKQYT